MRVLMVSRLWPPRAVGGAERYAAGLTEQLVDLGHEVGVVTYGVEGDRVLATVPTHGAVPDRWWESSALARRRTHLLDLWNPEARRVLARTVVDFRPDVVHSHGVAGLSVAGLLTEAPRVHTVHDEWLLCWRGSRMRDGTQCATTCLGCRPYEVSRRWLVGRRPPLFLSPSQALLDTHAAHGWDAARWTVLHHPVDTPAPPRRDRPQPRRPLQLGFLGQLSPVKGFDLLLEAMSRLAGKATLVCAGEGSLQAQAQAHPAVDYRGRVGGEAKERFFDDLDALVVPSRVAEAAGLVVMEAAMRQVPVLAARIGGLPEYVPASCRPLLFAPNDPDAIVRAVEDFTAAPETFRVDSYPGLSWEAHTSHVLDAYARAVRDGAG